MNAPSDNLNSPAEIDKMMPTIAPTGPPTRVTLSKRAGSEAVINWVPPTLRHMNGKCIGFKVVYYVDSHKNLREINISDAKATHHQFYDLDSKSSYFFQVAAVNDRGIGPFSLPVHSPNSGGSSH
ncbi:hypothetical protein Ciccas_000826 [Cichlidogyrus casuarinus]|uniref:Fibronectin type-III domain-containing protein n=1 Tax=Cichlidogyrus casuarinus TaxID=1844966 RepID=A0ABD2QLU2_9PLAT